MLECKVDTKGTDMMMTISTEQLLATRMIQGRAFSLRSNTNEYLAEALALVDTYKSMDDSQFKLFSEVQSEVNLNQDLEN